jgi:DNA-binding transcriptional MocR family regulator
MTNLRRRYDELKSRGLDLSMQRGQPADENFDLANGLLTAVESGQTTSENGLDVRNYPGGITGLREARELFAPLLGASPSQMMVGNNTSLGMMGNLLLWAMARGVSTSTRPWSGAGTKFVVTVPGYDRHFRLLDRLGIQQVPVPMTGAGPDPDAVERVAGRDPSVKGMLFVPTYSNPTGETIADETLRRLVSFPAAAEDFTIIADDAYVVHHLTAEPETHASFLTTAEEAGNPHRVYVFGSTSKITFSGGGVGFMATSEENLKWYGQLVGSQMITPNKVEQLRHVRFLSRYPGGIPGIMQKHAEILRPKFEAVATVLRDELSGTGLATWTEPKGGYFVSLDTSEPVADRVVALAADAGVALTPAGATFPHGKDPNNRNIRLAPTRPPVSQVAEAMEVLGVCIKLASEEAL